AWRQGPVVLLEWRRRRGWSGPGRGGCRRCGRSRNVRRRRRQGRCGECRAGHREHGAALRAAYLAAGGDVAAGSQESMATWAIETVIHRSDPDSGGKKASERDASNARFALAGIKSKNGLFPWIGETAATGRHRESATAGEPTATRGHGEATASGEPATAGRSDAGRHARRHLPALLSHGGHPHFLQGCHLEGDRGLNHVAPGEEVKAVEEFL